MRISELRSVFGTVYGRYSFLTLFLFLAIFFLYVSIPVVLTPGHSLSLFVEITPWRVWLIFFVFSLVLAVLLTFQYYIWRYLKTNVSSKFGLGLSGIMAFLVSLATCVACSVTIISLILPVTGLIFFNTYLYWFMALGFLVSLVALYYSARVINKECDLCVS